MLQGRGVGPWFDPAAGPVYVVGLMSGTSVDGMDAALIRIDPGEAGLGYELLAFDTLGYSAQLRAAILQLCDPASSRVDQICHLNFVVGEVAARAVIRVVEQAGMSLADIDLIGSAGQTIYHIPEPMATGDLVTRSTLQIGEAAVIAERTGITTITDFRVRDVAAGGHGAPLVTLVDHLLFHEQECTRVLQNIGGIANATVLPAGGRLQDVTAFDTGPGNMIIDALVTLTGDGSQTFDQDGVLAARGTPDPGLLQAWLVHPFIARRPPKTTGREEFGESFAREMLAQGQARGLSAEDIVATATEFTAASIAINLDRYVAAVWGRVDEVIVGGGGSYNPTLMRMLAERLRPVPVRPLEDLGAGSDAKEAVAFAILAYRTACGLPGNVPQATGASRPVLLGKVVPGAGVSR